MRKNIIDISKLIESKSFLIEDKLLYYKPNFADLNFKVFVFIIFLFLGFIGFFGFILAKNKDLKNKYYDNIFYYELIPAKRGIIYSSDKYALAYNEPIFSIVLYRKDYNSIQNKKDFINKLQKFLGIEKEKINEKIEEFKEKSVVVIEEIDKQKALSLLPSFEYDKNFPIKIVENFRRKYKEDFVFSHILGYVKRDKLIYKGLLGVEKYYDDILSGTPGFKKYLRDSSQDILQKIEQKTPYPGKNIVVTINYKLQKELFKIVNDVLKENNLNSGAAVVSNPKNGEILALVSIPSFNANELSSNLTKEEFSEILKTQSLFNKVISGLYAPGSIFKIVTAIGVLNEKIISPYERIKAPAFLSLSSLYNKNIKFYFKDWRDHGYINLEEALAYSSNSYFYKVSSGVFDYKKGLGKEKLIKYAKETVFGKKLGIDLINEKPGFIPDPKNMKIGDLLNLSIGQGRLLVTLLQINTLTNLVANEGFYYRPHIFKGTVNNNFTFIEKVKQEKIPLKNINKNIFKYIKEGMCKSVLIGTSRRIREITEKACAKTGTSQISDNLTNSLFTLYYPNDNPEISISVVIEKGGEGYTTALEVAKRFLKFYIENKNDLGNKTLSTK